MRHLRRPLRPMTFAILILSVVVLGSVPLGLSSATLTTPQLGLRAAPHGPSLAPSAIAPPSVSEPQRWSCHGIRMLGTAACGGPLGELGPAGSLNTAAGWTQVNASPPPQALYDFEMTYDASDGYVLLLGTTTAGGGSQGTTDLWTYSNDTWAPLHPAVMPQNCPGSMLAYDSHDDYVVYLGSASYACTSANQTWTYHAGVWTQLTFATGPSARYFAGLVDDPADGYLLLFGGESSSCSAGYGWCNDTWSFSAGSWTLLHPTTAPSARGESGIAYDAVDRAVLLFGGTGATGNLNDTWNYSGGAWTQLHPVHTPPVPTPDAFGYDSTDKAVVYTTAFNYSGPVYEVTWTYSNGDWSPVNSTGPLQRLGAASTDDPGDHQFLFFGGTSNYDLADTWGLHAGIWTNLTPRGPAPRWGAAETYDAASHQFLLYGGIGGSSGSQVMLGDLWSLSAGAWSQIAIPASSAPPARGYPVFVYDAADGYVLLFGGYGANGSLADTWEYAGGAWTRLTPTTSPAGGSGAQPEYVYDAADGYVLLVYGSPGHQWTWTFSAGVWSNITTSAGTPPPGFVTNPLVYDSTDGYVLAFGTYGTSFTNQTWSFKGGVWKNLTSTAGNAPPAASGGGTLLDFPPGGYVLLFQGTGGNDTYTFANGSWAPLFAPNGPGPITYTAAGYDPVALAAVMFGGQGSGCYPQSICGGTWLWSNGAPGAPYIRSFSVSPPIVDVGRPTTFTVVAGGGVGPLTFAYLGLPAGCASANVSTLACTPTVVGGFLVEVTVTDSNHTVVTAATTLDVSPALVFVSFHSDASTVSLGGTTILRANVTGGSPPYTYAYSGLPPGCPSQTVPALPCTPTASGNYTIGVAVTDAGGATVTASVSLSVRSAGAPGGPSISSFAAHPSAIVLGNTTNLSVVASGGTGTLSYAFSDLPAGCASSNATFVVCRPTAAGTFTTWVSVSDANYATTSVATNLTVFPVGGGGGLTVSAFAATPAALAVGGSTVLVVTATGGTGPIGYAYAGLPPGCLAANLSKLPCRPSAAGSYLVQVVAFDSSGHRAGVLTALEVAPALIASAPSIGGFVVSPSTATVNEPLTILVSVGGGATPLRYAYSGLPAGCTSDNAVELQCTPTETGNFTLVVVVTDTTNRSTSASTPLTVLPKGPLGGGSSPSGATPSLLSSPWVLGGLFAAGIVAAVLFGRLRARQRERQLGRELVRRLREAPPPDPPDRGADLR